MPRRRKEAPETTFDASLRGLEGRVQDELAYALQAALLALETAMAREEAFLPVLEAAAQVHPADRVAVQGIHRRLHRRTESARRVYHTLGRLRGMSPRQLEKPQVRCLAHLVEQENRLRSAEENPNA